MPKNSPKSTASGLFKLFILACLIFVGYGVYVYIQDAQDNQLSSEASQNDESTTDEADSEETALSEEEQTSGIAIDDSFQQLDRQVERDIKDKLIQEMDTETPAPSTNPSNGFISVTFSQYDQAEETLSMGIGFNAETGDDVETCQIVIQSGSHSVQQQTPARNQSDSSGGCRFNNINLSALPDPSISQAWQIKISIQDRNGEDLSVLNKPLHSITDIDNLNN